MYKGGGGRRFIGTGGGRDVIHLLDQHTSASTSTMLAPVACASGLGGELESNMARRAYVTNAGLP